MEIFRLMGEIFRGLQSFLYTIVPSLASGGGQIFLAMGVDLMSLETAGRPVHCLSS